MSASPETLQSLDRLVQALDRLVERGLPIAHLGHESPYLTLEEGAIRYRFTVTAPKEPVQAFREWLGRHAIPIKRRGRDGRTLLVERAVVDAAIEG